VAYGKHPESIISIHLGSYWSSVFGNAKITGKMLNEDLGYEKITAYDTGTVTMGIGFMAIEAARLASEGQSKEEIVKKLDNMKERLTVVASLNTLKYLESGGRGHRIEGIRNLFGQVIGIKPVIKIDHNNMEVFKKCFSRDDALKTLVSFAKNYGTLERVGVMYGGDEDDRQKAQQVLNNIKKFYKGNIYFGDIGTAVLRHAGPGAIGVVLVRKE
jgi:DegV family protein with EDD domain